MKQHRKRIRSMALVAAFCLLFSSLGFLSSSAVGNPTVTINGKTLPLQIYKYRPEEYYTNNGQACNHSVNENNCKLYTPTTGVGFPRGIQCYAFALDVYCINVYLAMMCPTNLNTKYIGAAQTRMDLRLIFRAFRPVPWYGPSRDVPVPITPSF